MALLYPWATKEYLLWNMSLPQIILYHNVGVDMKYPKPSDDGTARKAASIRYMSPEQVAKLRAEARDMMADKYGDIDDA